MAASARAKRRAVGAQRARVQTQTRAERRRDIVQRSAAIAAAVRTADVDAQPMSAGLAFRIDALHGPSGQILHRFPPWAIRPTFPLWPEGLAGLCSRGTCVSRGNTTISRGSVAKATAIAVSATPRTCRISGNEILLPNR